MNGRSRYPGIRAFEENEQFLFFGRNDEIRRLYAQVTANTLVVLFAKSGIGKSSLLNAGLLPLLDFDRYRSVKVRFQSTGTTPTDALKSELKSYLNAGELLAQTGHSPDSAPLWEYLRACHFERHGETATPMLVFDQFEEFFEHSPAERERFIKEIADLVNNRLPQRVYSAAENRLDWHTPIPVKVIFAIRSDRVSLLHDLGSDIPAILQNRFELRPLGREAAGEGIVQPAAIVRREMATPPFTYLPAALDQILDALENKNAEVESFQLQLVCQYIEKQLAKGAADISKPVDESVFGGTEGIRNILQNYYEDTLAELPADGRALARDFIERGLIVGGRRVGVTEGVEREVWRIEPDLLKKLLDTRLVRAEITHLGKSFEVSHDALVEPIVRSFKATEALRLEAEKAQLEQEAAEQRRIAEQERQFKEKAEKDARRARLFSGVSLLLLLLTVGIGFFSLRYARDNFIGQGNDKLADQRYREATDLYEQVLDNPAFVVTFYNRGQVAFLRDSALHMAGTQGIVLEGDTLYFKGDYYHAIRQYELAQRLGYRGVKDKISRTDQLRRLLLDIYRRKALVFEEARVPGNPARDDGATEEACIYYCLAYGLDPESGELMEKLKELGCACGK
ncbi:MAG: hypothetical protein KA165_06190 [Saprospiraceae bacterium]|nr:hypothetical protein [Saprospiraceae bacterium]